MEIPLHLLFIIFVRHKLFYVGAHLSLIDGRAEIQKQQGKYKHSFFYHLTFSGSGAQKPLSFGR
jgi:hypothetical protein